MIEKKIYLFKEEFWPLCKITRSQWDRRKEELLIWMKNFFDYELLDGRPMRILIKNIYGDYQPLPRKNYGGEEHLEMQLEKQKDYDVFTIAALGTDYKPNSKSKIARDAINRFGRNKYGHNNSYWVARKYISEPFGKYGETNNHQVWVYYSTYEPLEKDELEVWRNILAEERIDERDAANAFYKQAQGQDVSQEIGFYKKAQDKFKERYGDIAVLVKEWRGSNKNN